MDNNDVDEEEFYKYLNFDHENEDWANIIELADYLTELEFSESDQEPPLQWQPEYGFSLRSSATYHPKKILLEKRKGHLARVSSGRDVLLKSIKSVYTKLSFNPVPFCVCVLLSLLPHHWFVAYSSSI